MDKDQRGERRAAAQVNVSVKVVGENETEIKFTNHAACTLDTNSGMVFLTFTQFALPNLNWLPKEKIDNGEITVPASTIARLAMPVDRFREFFDRINIHYDEWFDGQRSSEGDEG